MKDIRGGDILIAAAILAKGEQGRHGVPTRDEEKKALLYRINLIKEVLEQA